MNYQDIIQILYIILLTEVFVILVYVIAIMIDLKKSIDRVKVTLDKFQSVGNKALDIADDLEVKVKKIISFADLLGDIPNIISSVFFGKNKKSASFFSHSEKREKRIDDEINLSREDKAKIIRKRII